MKIVELADNSKVKIKAGVIPFIRTKQGIKMMFMTPSNPKFGGDSPCIAKGGVGHGENIKSAAFREAGEELGLRSSNFLNKPFFVGKNKIDGMKNQYELHIYSVEVKNIKDFGQHDYEVGRIDWLTLDEYKRVGRSSQLNFVQAVVNNAK